ncbi:MAG: acyclic terpene utilization AtuA family protein [Vicinamibacteraceae bacterium]
MRASVRIGCGAGYSGDRIEPAVELAEQGRLDYLVFECLAERTIALAQLRKARDPRAGYDPLLAERMRAVLPVCVEHGVTIVTNMGAANPLAGAEVVREVARELGLHGVPVAAVTGDDVLATVTDGGFAIDETGAPVESLGDALVSANAYIGAGPIVEALAQGARVVVTGRAADPSLFVGPLRHAFGWSAEAWELIGRATVVGHLLECAGQVTGGYFADPGRTDVAGLARLGFPIAEVAADGRAVVTKVPGSGGAVTIATCTEQLLYEIGDPAAYVTPDVVADFSGVRLALDGANRVRVSGATGQPAPATLKVALGHRDGFIGEGQMSYAGSGAVARARLAGAIVEERLRLIGLRPDAIRCDLIGVDALHGAARAASCPDPYEVRLRVAARTRTRAEADAIGREVEALYTNGPYGGGGATASTRDVLAIASTYVPRARVACRVTMEAS